MELHIHTDRRAVSRNLVILGIALAVLSALAILPVAANPPADMTLAYDDDQNALVVTITHPVADPENHYIKNIEVKRNGVVAIESLYTGQPSSTSFSYTYPFPVQPGDEIDVTASCILGGSLTKQMTIGEATTAAVQTQKATAGMIPILGLAILLLYKKGKMSP